MDEKMSKYHNPAKLCLGLSVARLTSNAEFETSLDNFFSRPRFIISALLKNANVFSKNSFPY